MVYVAHPGILLRLRVLVARGRPASSGGREDEGCSPLLRAVDQPPPPSRPCQPSTKQEAAAPCRANKSQNFLTPRFYVLRTFMKWFLQPLHNSNKANTKGKGGASSSFLHLLV